MTPLRQARNDKGWSKSRLAHELERLAQGRHALATRASLLRMISAWESGERDASDPYRSLLCEAYGLEAVELGLSGSVDRVRSDAGLAYQASLNRAASSLDDLTRFDDMGHTAVTRGRYIPDALSAACLDWLFGSSVTDLPNRGGAVTGHDIEEMRTMTSTFDGLDRKFGGDHCRLMAVRYLRDRVLPKIYAVKPARVERDLFSATAILCELVGWMAYDTSRHSLAQRYFVQALRFAEAAGDRAYAAYVLTSMADQALHLRRPDHALRLAQVAREASSRTGVAVAITEACVFEARAFAAQGDEAGCTAALLRAERTFHQIDGGDRPAWSGHWGEALFVSHAGTCWVDLGKTQQARRMFALIRDDTKGQARRRIYGAVQLARVALLEGDVEQSCAFATRALESAAGLASRRSHEHLVRISQQLATHGQQAAVRDFQQRADLLLAG
ncbi:helix-turn-helix domain-containing protein [Micromonospora cathayae]|uniref:Helix-turn-helix transcriptional regulator n=1 Tax=Micromonospora cathayae TaxID=3028804 RepID=A0ABY7ZPZ5_9ACTN|nr:helix-turn-helix transcriptional regulator [Micromonospora sp. HUAS 3]WDZ84573.1 helix-turn-helix transcriptional regulator [Micromonospora sp. HUAS 3]